MSNIYEKCPKCGAAVEDGALFCGDCGYKFDNLVKTENAENSEAIAASSQKHKFVLIVIIAVIAILAVLAVINLFGHKNVNSSAGTNMFSEGLLAVEDSSERWGYINQKGEYVISPQFSEAYPFESDGTAVVFVGNKLAIIDKKGKFVVQPMKIDIDSDDFGGFANNGLAYVGDGYINKSGKYIIECDDNRRYHDFAPNGLALSSVKVNDKSLYGYIDKTGDFVIEPKFSKAYSFNDDGLAAVYDDSKNQWLFIDKNKTVKIEIPYGYSYFNATMISSYESFDSYYRDCYNGKTVRFSSNGWLPICSENEDETKYGLINKNGKIIVKPQFYNIVAISNGWALVTKRDEDGKLKYGFVTPKETVIEPQFDEAQYSIVLNNNGFEKYMSDNGLQPVCKDDDWGYIDETGSFAISPQFDWASPFYDGFAKITVGDSGGVINSKGTYDSLPFERTNYFYNIDFIGDLNFVAVSDMEYAFYDKNGKKVIVFNFVDNKYLEVNGNTLNWLPDELMPLFYDDRYTFWYGYDISTALKMLETGAISSIDEYDIDYHSEKLVIMDSKGNIIASGFKDARTKLGLASEICDS